jgi:hypothetical protein
LAGGVGVGGLVEDEERRDEEKETRKKKKSHQGLAKTKTLAKKNSGQFPKQRL